VLVKEVWNEMLQQKESWTDATDDTETKTLAIKTLNCQDEER
jgi:hypothetical protein